jgi:succinoglycan biosynthesis protein ExoM
MRRTAHAFQGLRFRQELGRTGGEDTVFFAALHRAGGKITYAPEAIVTEAVPATRAAFWWLLKCRFRSGQTHGLLLLEKEGTNTFTRAKNIAVAAAKILFCLGAALLNIMRPARGRSWLLRGALHAGVVAQLLGFHAIRQYG